MTAKTFGYARVSTEDQSLDLQRDALRQAGCEIVFEEKASGANAARPELERMMSQLRKGDCVFVWKLDRLGRSTRHLIELIEKLRDMDVDFISLQEKIDTTSPAGEMLFTIMAALAQFERSMIVERTKAGLKAARARGRVGGRPKLLSGKDLKTASALMDSGSHSLAEIAERLGVSRSTLYRAMQEQL